jgi:hypothetical protein
MLTRQEIEEWHVPPCTEQVEWLLKIANGFIDFKPSIAQNKRRTSMHTPELSSPGFCREKAEECLALSYQITDPKKQVAILKRANCWMRLAEYSCTENQHQSLK